MGGCGGGAVLLMDRGRQDGMRDRKRRTSISTIFLWIYQTKTSLSCVPLDHDMKDSEQDASGRHARIDFPDIWPGDIFLTIDWLSECTRSLTFVANPRRKHQERLVFFSPPETEASAATLRLTWSLNEGKVSASVSQPANVS